MGTRTLKYTITGSESGTITLATMDCPAFTGSYTITASVVGPTNGTHNMTFRFTRVSDGNNCFQTNLAFSGGAVSASTTLTVGSPSASWHGLDFSRFDLVNSSTTWSTRAGQVLTVTLTGANVTDPAFCWNGTRPTSTAPGVALVTDAAIAAACTAIGMPWLAVLFAPLVGYAIDTGALCGTGPPTMPTITTSNLLSDAASRVAALQSAMWYTLCECVPGNPVPPPFVCPVQPQPPDWRVDPTYTCDPANLCATLTLILKRLDELSQTDINTLQLLTTVQRYKAPFGVAAGTPRTGLTGSGSFAVIRPLGFRVDVTAGTPGRVLEGTPPYQWNQGWLSISDGTRILEEKRLSQTTLEWYPEHSTMATTFSYWLYPGMVITVTPLDRAP